MKIHRYTPEQISFLAEHIQGASYTDLTEQFNRAFGLNLTIKKVKSTCQNRGMANKKKSGFLIGSGYPIGAEVKSYDGNIYIKTEQRSTLSKKHPLWKKKQIFIWEDAYGPLPEGYTVIFADGDNNNFSLDNLLEISLAELLYINKHHLLQENYNSTETENSAAKLAVKETTFLLAKLAVKSYSLRTLRKKKTNNTGGKNVQQKVA